MPKLHLSSGTDPIRIGDRPYRQTLPPRWGQGPVKPLGTDPDSAMGTGPDVLVGENENPCDEEFCRADAALMPTMRRCVVAQINARGGRSGYTSSLNPCSKNRTTCTSPRPNRADASPSANTSNRCHSLKSRTTRTSKSLRYDDAFPSANTNNPSQSSTIRNSGTSWKPRRL